ncbi:hypothetical protein ACFYWX_09840 [Streptomyces sp. NPDC002888]|uniref:hypothetical protein n=1 Tax=Streptomyces sp. NPDC002888 TaxID=3364668 RepID=UPI0036AD3260
MSDSPPDRAGSPPDRAGSPPDRAGSPLAAGFPPSDGVISLPDAAARRPDDTEPPDTVAGGPAEAQRPADRRGPADPHRTTAPHTTGDAPGARPAPPAPDADAGADRVDAEAGADEVHEDWAGGDWSADGWGDFDWASHRERARPRGPDGGAEGRSRLAIEFELGVAGGADDPDSDAGSGQPEDRVTVVTDRLLIGLGEAGQACPECHHTFRLGEEVVVDRDPAAGTFALRHRGRLLGCGNAGTLDTHTSRLAGDFHRGLDETNPPSGDMHPVRLAPDHKLVALHAGVGDRPSTRFTCWVCDMTLRPGDLVIHCTCSPHHPACMGAIHRDPERGNLCYDDWRAHNDTIPCVGGGGG